MGGGLPYSGSVLLGGLLFCGFVVFAGWLLMQPNRGLRKYSVPFALFAFSSLTGIAASYQVKVVDDANFTGLPLLVALSFLSSGIALLAYFARKPKEKPRNKPDQKF